MVELFKLKITADVETTVLTKPEVEKFFIDLTSNITTKGLNYSSWCLC